jgi:hypothetical protein
MEPIVQRRMGGNEASVSQARRVDHGEIREAANGAGGVSLQALYGLAAPEIARVGSRSRLAAETTHAR